MNQRRPLQFPVAIPPQEIGSIVVTEAALTDRLGPPAKASDDSSEFPGPVLLWAFEVEDGMQVLIEFHRSKDFALVFAHPPLLDEALIRLGLQDVPVDWRASPAALK